MRDAFLIDECLYPGLVAVANARGHHATHVIYRGLKGIEDPDLVPIAVAEKLVIVTSNGRDFLRLYARQEIHQG